MLTIFQYDFMLRALEAGLIIALIAPLIGSFLVVRRYSLIADTLSHVALSGVAIALILGTQPIATTVVVTVVASLLIEGLRSQNKIPSEAVLAMFLPGGLALSIVLISVAHGFNANLFSYLFGSITTVRQDEIYLIAGLGFITVGAVIILYKKLLYTSFDEESARVSGIPVTLINSALMILTAVTVSLSMRVVGVLLIGALMVIPVVTAMQVSRSFFQSMYLAVFVALTEIVLGLFISYYFNLPAGGTVVLLSLFVFSLVAIFSRKG